MTSVKSFILVVLGAIVGYLMLYHLFGIRTTSFYWYPEPHTTIYYTNLFVLITTFVLFFLLRLLSYFKIIKNAVLQRTNSIVFICMCVCIGYMVYIHLLHNSIKEVRSNLRYSYISQLAMQLYQHKKAAGYYPRDITELEMDTVLATLLWLDSISYIPSDDQQTATLDVKFARQHYGCSLPEDTSPEITTFEKNIRKTCKELITFR